MAILVPDTTISIAKDGTRGFGPFAIADAARSILIVATRTSWPVQGTRHASFEFQVFRAELEISIDGGNNWKPAGHVGCNGGTFEIAISPSAFTRIGLWPGVNRIGRVTCLGLIGLSTTIRVENSITLGTPGESSGFGSSGSVTIDAGSGTDRCFVASITRTNRAMNSGAFVYNGVNLLAGNAIHAAVGTPGTTIVGNAGRIIAATGSASLAFSTSSSGDSRWYMVGTPLDGVDQTTPHDGAVSSLGTTNASLTVDVTSETGDMVMDNAMVNGTGPPNTISIGAGQNLILLENVIASAATAAGTSWADGATTVTMDWTGNTTPTTVGILAWNMNAAGGAAAANPIRLLNINQAVNRASTY